MKTISKKGSALVIGLLIIAALGTVALTVARSVISGVGIGSRLSDAMVAEQAAGAGIEYGLLRYKNTPDYTTPSGQVMRCDLESTASDPCAETSAGASVLPNKIYADVTISGVAPSKVIKSIGRFGGVSKKHTLSQ